MARRSRTNCSMNGASGLWNTGLDGLLDMARLLRVQRGAAQRFRVRLRVDEGRCRRGVPQDRGDDVDGGLPAQQLRCKGMAQGMKALLPPAAQLDPCRTPPTRHDVVQIAVYERPERRRVLEEHFAVPRLRTTESEIVDQRFAEFFGNRQPERRAGLGLRDLQGCGVPVEVVESQRADVARPQAQPGGQQQYRVVPLAPLANCDRRPSAT